MLCSMAKSLIILLFFAVLALAQDETQFIYNGFQGARLHLDGIAEIRSNGLLQLTNTSKQQSGHVFFPKPIHFNETNLSFSTSFVFAMFPDVPDHGGHGIAFVITSSMNFSQAVPAEYLGIFNISNNGLSSNHIFAVELDTVQNALFNDIDGNHVGIDIDGLKSNDSSSAGYYSDDERMNKTIQLTSGKPMQIWIDDTHGHATGTIDEGITNTIEGNDSPIYKVKANPNNSAKYIPNQGPIMIELALERTKGDDSSISQNANLGNGDLRQLTTP